MRRVSRSTSLQAPTGGWNTRDSIAMMDTKYAPILTNWFPYATDVLLRKGYTNHATGITGQVESLLIYSGGATDKMFACAGSSIYETTSAGAVGAAVVTSLSTARFQYQSISTSGGDFMLCVNGVDKLRGYDGTNWWADGDGTHDITGFNTVNASNILLFKNRIWMLEGNTLNAWYLGTSSIAGAATKFPLAAVARKGGYLVAADAWTIDAGYGVDDMIAFITSNGEVIVYRGTDPASASTWSLVGIWEIGAPVGKRSLFKYAGDLLVLGQDGLTPMSAALQSTRTNARVNLTDIIQPTISNSIGLYGDQFGWETIYYPQNNMILINVPIAVGGQVQYVMNTITKAWCKFEGWDANCFAIFNDELYYGGNGIVAKAWSGFTDNGAEIDGEAAQAFSYFGSPGTTKRWTMIRPVLYTDGSPSIVATINVDFQMRSNYAPLALTPITYATWDSALWDVGTWANSLSIVALWQGVAGVGYSAGVELECAASGIEVRWVSTDIVYEMGQVL